MDADVIMRAVRGVESHVKFGYPHDHSTDMHNDVIDSRHLDIVYTACGTRA